ncbi:hypothetical protein SB764_43390, partial [Paraburkholderia sp. SIMBA_027]
MDQGTEALLQVFAMGLQRIYRARERLWLVGDQAQQAGLGANAGEILAKVVVQGLRQVGAFLFLYRQQGLGQLGVIGTG